MSKETRGYHHSGFASQCHQTECVWDPCITLRGQFSPAPEVATPACRPKSGRRIVPRSYFRTIGRSRAKEEHDGTPAQDARAGIGSPPCRRSLPRLGQAISWR